MTFMMLCLLGILFFVLWYTFSASVAWYRLRQIPAPSLLAAISYLWLGKTTYSGKQYWVHRELHRKYGPLVRIGPNDILTDDPEIIKKISSARCSYRRGDWYLAARFNPYHDNMFTILDPKAHAEARERRAAAYSGRESPALKANINAQLRTLVDLLRRKYAVPASSTLKTTKPLLDLGMMSSYLTMDIITSLAFGKEFGYLKDETDHYNFLRGVRELWPRLSTSADIPWIRTILFSQAFLRVFGPKSTDKTGFGALMA